MLKERDLEMLYPNLSCSEIVCRSIENHEKLLLRCKDLVHDNGNHIIVLDDTDILNLLKLRNINDEKLIDDFFESKFDELIL